MSVGPEKWDLRKKGIQAIAIAAVLLLNCFSVIARGETAKPCKGVWEAQTTQSADYLVALSGGGYRAMLFHLGALTRLNDSGLLGRIEMFSSVSGGSITAGALAKAWPQLMCEQNGVAINFISQLRDPLMRLASTTIDTPSILIGLFSPSTAADQVSRRYEEYLFGDMRLRDMPDQPSFVFSATSLQTGEIWSFGKDLMGGSKIGWTSTADLRVSQAVTASSAFPPFLSPVEIELHDHVWFHDVPERVGFGANPETVAVQVIPDETRNKFRRHVVLVDGGVRDNLGFVAMNRESRSLQRQRRCNVVEIVSDGGAAYLPDADPPTIWISQAKRIIDIGLSEPDQIRIEALVQQSLERDDSSRKPCTPDAAFWSIQRIPKWHNEYGKKPDFWITAEDVGSIGKISTRLAALDETTQQRIVNWGYLAAHHGLPFVNALFRESKILSVCSLPFPTGISERTNGAPLCPPNFE